MTRGRIPIKNDYALTDLVHLKIDPYGGDPSSQATTVNNYFKRGNVLQGLPVNVMHYGAIGDGATSDTVAIQNAIAAAGEDGTVFFPSGKTFLIDYDEIVIMCNIYGHGAILKVTSTGAGTALALGDGTATYQYKRMVLPRVQYTGTGQGVSWQAGSIGVKVIGIATSFIYVSEIKQFEKGLFCTASADAAAVTAYNTLQIIHLLSNKVNVYIDGGGAGTGWCNEQLYLGGRMSHGGGYGTNNANCHQIKIEDNSDNRPDNHRFIGASIEGNGPENLKTIVCDATNSLFDWLRWESTNPGIVYPSVGANRNLVRTPYVITVTDSGSDNRYEKNVVAANIGNPAGGGVIDAEARTAIDAIIAALEGIGISAA